MLRNAKTGTRIAVGFAVPGLLILFLAVFVYWALSLLAAHSGSVTRSHDAIAAGNALVAAMVDEESGERGFIITGDESFLEPYEAGKRNFASSLEKARELVAGDPEQLERLQRAADLARSWEEGWAQPLIDLRRTTGVTVADVARRVQSRTGKKDFDALRAVVKEFVDAEQARLASRTSKALGAARLAQVGDQVIAVLALLLGALATWLVARSVVATVRALAAESARLTAAVQAGRLVERADVEAVGPEFRPVLEGMNATMDAFARPIGLTLEYVTRISRGDIPPSITEEAQGDFQQINGAFNRCIESVQALVQDATMLARAAVEGRLATRADVARHQGDFRTIIQGVNEALDAVVGPLSEAARCIDAIARGAIPGPITARYQGDFDALKGNLNTCMDSVRALIRDAQALASAAVEGRLAVRADAAAHPGDFRKIVEGMNATMDAVVAPLTMAARSLEQISRGQIPPPIAEAYVGEYAKLRDSINTCIEAVNRLVRDTNALVGAAVAGRLTQRADAAAHAGEFRRVVEGVNQTLEAVTTPVSLATSALERLANRDLRARVEGSFQGDHARIQVAVNASAEALDQAIAQVSLAVEQVSGAATQIAASSQVVASGASEQASSLERTGGSVQSIATMMRGAADSAEQASRLAVEARGAASEGATAVQQLQGAMENVTRSAEGTSQIIRDVSDIAFQTNLLALNAAVEAARAGEAGRGFAVVAEEVRSLALRAKEAASKTEDLIRVSVRQAGEGREAAGKVASTLSQILTSVTKVTDIVGEIASSVREQANGIAGLDTAVGEMDRVTQQNAASAEEASAAASELSGQAQELAAMVGSFQLASDPNRRLAGQTAGAPHPRLKGVA